MTIKAEDIERTDLADVSNGGQMPLIHPGEHLADYIEGAGVSQYRVAKATYVPPRRINEIVKGQRAITADTAVRLGRFFGTSPMFWMNLQSAYDVAVAGEKMKGLTIEPVGAAT